MKYDNWTTISWSGNSAIPFKCEAITLKGYTFILHKKFICSDIEGNNGLGSWDEGNTFDFTVKGQYSGMLPENITEWDAAKAYIETYTVL
jgi:hypothetical protein